MTAKNFLKVKAEEIRSKENPTDEEISMLDQLDTLIETSDPMDLINAQREVQLLNMVKEQKEIADRDKLIEQYGEESYMKYKAQEAIEEQMIIKTSRAPNYQQMKIRVNDIQRLYPNVNIELAQNYDNLSEEEKAYVDKNSYSKGVKGYYNKDTDKVVIFADNIKNQADLEKTFAHETAGHKGLEVLLGNDYDNVIKQIYEEVKTTHAAELQKLAETYGKNLEVAADQKYIMEEFLANQADLEQAGFFKSLVQKIKMALRKCGFNAKWTDNEIKTLLRRSLAKQQSERIKDKQKLTEKNAARFAIIGEQGAAQLDKYSKQNNLDNLQIAKEMFAKGEDPKTIKFATGWEKGGDGKWRMEIPDLTIITKRKLPDGNEYNIDNFAFLDDYLENIVNAPELFAAYDQLRRIRVISANIDSLGSYSKENNRIYINYNNFINLPLAQQKDLLQTVLIHEVQHAIQYIEGFAIGSSPEYFEKFPVKKEYRLDELNVAQRAFDVVREKGKKY